MTQVRASGGGAKSPVWRQIHADVTGHPHVTLSVDEGPALGVALLAAVGTGAYPTVADACRAAIQTVAETAPDPAVQLPSDCCANSKSSYRMQFVVSTIVA